MHLVKENVRLAALVAAMVAVVLAASSLAPPPKKALAVDPASPQGILCGTFEGMTLNGNPHFSSRFGMTITRIDLDYNKTDGNPNDVAISAAAYIDPALIDPVQLTWPECKIYQTQPPAGAIVPDVQAEARPGILAKWDPNGKKITGSECLDNFSFGATQFPPWTKVTTQILVGAPPAQTTGSFTFESGHADNNCNTVGGLTTFVVTLKADYYDGPGGDKSAYDSDWDKDGCLDWVELDPHKPHRDPFAAGDKQPCTVGGIAELPQVTGGTPLEAAGSSGSNSALIAGVVAAGTAVVLAVGGMAWYARRRWL